LDRETVDLPSVNTPLGTALSLKTNSADLGTAAYQEADQNLQTTDDVYFNSVNSTGIKSSGTVTAKEGIYKTGEDINFFTITNLNTDSFPVASTAWFYGSNFKGQISSVNQGLKIRGNSQILFFSDLVQIVSVNATGVDVVGKIQSSGTIQPGTYTVATLPTGNAGMRATVSDSDKHAQGNFGSTVVAAAGGTSYVVPVFFDGTNWIIA